MKKVLTLLILVLFFSLPAYAETSYWANMRRDFGRGLKNVITSPLEIPITMQEYHERSGRPLVRHMAGFVDGLFRAVTRFGSGGFDFIAGLIPGQQEGLPVHPETLF